MSWKNRQLGQTRFIGLGTAVTTSGNNASAAAAAPSSQTIALITSAKLTDWISTGEVWRPLGVQMQTTTSTTVTPPAVTLQKSIADNSDFDSPVAGGVATQGAVRTAPFAEYQAFTNWLNSDGSPNLDADQKADVAGDCWRVTVTTTSTAGAVIFQLGYALIDVAGISDALTTY